MDAISGLAIVILIIVVFMTTLYGYIKNILKLLKITSLNGEVIVRTIGIFIFPLGVIMGFVK